MDARINQFNDLTFPVTRTDKLRLYVTNGTVSPQTNDNHARVFELEVWEHDPDPQGPEIPPVYVHGIHVTPQHRISRIDTGQTLAIEAQVLPENADDRSLTWRVEAPDGTPTALASIDQQGQLTALGTGSVTVIAEANDGSRVSGRTVIEIAEPPAQPNIAPQAAVTSSSAHESGSFPPQHAVNGKRHSGPDRWVSGPEGPHWLELTWEDAYEVEGVRLWSGQSDAQGMQLSDFAIEVWDGDDWATVASVTGNTEDNYYGQYTALQWEPVQTSRVRLQVSKGNLNGDDRVRLFEIEVYGKEADGTDPEPEPESLPAIGVSGPAAAYAGQSVVLIVGATASTTGYTTINAIVAYDPAVLSFATAEEADGMLTLSGDAISSGRDGLSILGTAVKPAEGLINILLSAPDSSLQESGEWFKLHGQVKDQPQSGETTVHLTKAEIIDTEGEVLSLPTAEATHAFLVSLADLGALGEAIAAAQALHDGASAGSSPGQYPAAAKTALQTSIHTAQAVHEDPNADQQAVSGALTALAGAVQTFRASQIQSVPVDKEALRLLIEQAQVLVDRTSAGTKVGQYPQAAKTLLQEAILAAETIYHQSHPQSAVNEAVEELSSQLTSYRQERITLIEGETQITLRTLSIVAGYFGMTSADPGWSAIAAADMLDQEEITIQSLAAVARMILSDWYDA
ncbi:discoidin domain-containing protein [Paenibacillus sp. 1P07SE]|uniref:discoidin domain-containing protein n=1 Tax=Paenibacillus sp. 1P07SE TaxID=3132209 RepID=UPI0039A42A24